MAPIIAALIPLALKALASPLVAGTAASFIANKFGLSDSTVEGITNFLNGLKPDEQIKIKELDQEFRMFVIQQNNQAYLAELDLIKLQLEINKTEAQHQSRFIAGWRPALGWMGVISLGLSIIPKSVVLTVMWTMQAIAAVKGNTPLPIFPELGTGEVVALLGTILGVGTLRSVDKYNEVDTKSL